MTGKDPWQLVHELRAELAAHQAHNVELREAATALVERWDTPNWKDAEHTGVFIARLRNALSRTTDTEALDAAIAKAVEESRAEHENDSDNQRKRDECIGRYGA